MSEHHQKDGRKSGSTALTIIMGCALVLLAIGLSVGNLKLNDYKSAVDIGTCVFFGTILFWWAFSKGMDRGNWFRDYHHGCHSDTDCRCYFDPDIFRNRGY